jgi:hypothetical protein
VGRLKVESPRVGYSCVLQDSHSVINAAPLPDSNIMRSNFL